LNGLETGCIGEFFLVFTDIILVWSIILFCNKNKNTLQFEIISSTKAIMLENIIQFFWA
jgi:hypothetical protein